MSYINNVANNHVNNYNINVNISSTVQNSSTVCDIHIDDDDDDEIKNNHPPGGPPSYQEISWNVHPVYIHPHNYNNSLNQLLQSIDNQLPPPSYDTAIHR